MTECNLSIAERKLIIATLSKETKEKVDSSSFPKEYKDALEMKIIDDFTNYQIRPNW